MGFFGSLTKLALDVLETPVAIVKDVVTLGGSINEHGSYTAKKLEDMGDNYGKMKDSLDDE